MYSLQTFAEIFSKMFGEIPESNFSLYLSEHDQTNEGSANESKWEMGATSVSGIRDTFGLVERDVFIDDIRVMLLPTNTHRYYRNMEPHQKLTGCEAEEGAKREQYMEIFMHIRETGDDDGEKKFAEETASPKGHVFQIEKPHLKDIAALFCPSNYAVQIVCDEHYYADFSDFALLYYSEADFLKWDVSFIDLPAPDEEGGVRVITIGVVDPMADDGEEDQ